MGRFPVARERVYRESPTPRHCMTMNEQRNVLGGPLMACSYSPLTGYFRTGCCETDVTDRGQHVVCIKATAEFLDYSRRVGNDLSTPRPEYRFRGVQPGDRWCLCALRWLEAHEAGFAPPVVLEATNETALEVIPLELLREFALG
ncbi:DUF2237 domain-containing protein [Viridibacterium curvum]|uniref:DUF2237 domain-containing protein n=2 Tax=Viridibacterium curvum TaxID=1101404 RepID=A0ABP9R6V3_9RHOO